MLSNAYFLAKFRFDTAENEPAKNLQKFVKFQILQNLPILLTPSPRSDGAGVFDDAEAAGDDGRRTVPFVAEDSGVDLPLVAAARRDGS